MKLASAISIFVMISCGALQGQDSTPLRQARADLIGRGLWREVIDQYREVLIPISDAESGLDLFRACEAIAELNAWDEFDPLIETAIASHPENGKFLIVAGAQFRRVPHSGEMVGGVFNRKVSAGGRGDRFAEDSDSRAQAGASVSTDFRDRVRSLQILMKAKTLPLPPEDSLSLWREIAQSLNPDEAWELQILTPLNPLPEWSSAGPEGETEGAPWAGELPIVYEIPDGWDAAKNDGERWRFALAEQVRVAGENNVHAISQTILERAQFSESQFGVKTLQSYGWWQQMDPDTAKGILELDTLSDDECLAKTSDGVRRFKLPPEHHFIALYRQILDDKMFGETASDSLVQTYLDRQQPRKASEVLEQAIRVHQTESAAGRKELLEQIKGNWGRFEVPVTVPHGTSPAIPLVFRNATEISLTAVKVDMEAVLRDTIAYLEGNPTELDWNRLSPHQIAERLIEGKSAAYLGQDVTRWKATLTPEADFRDTTTELTVPLTRTGAWWITGTLTDGNEIHTLVWIVDSLIAHKNVGDRAQWWVSDAATGAPLAGCEMEFFGYQIVHSDREKPAGRRTSVATKRYITRTDAEGKCLIKSSDLAPNYQWLAMARPPGKAVAFNNFQAFYNRTLPAKNPSQDLGYGISDRPLYKPGDTAHFKFFVRNVAYSNPDNGKFSNQSGTLILRNGRGEEAVKIQNLTTDALGGVEADVVIPVDAPLGAWSASYFIRDQVDAEVKFQVEEFRKPEFEVSVESPTEPILLGGKFTATVRARYFHGSPVRNASVEVTVERTSLAKSWFPAQRWDWLYGVGAWWNSGESSWHPTWERWKCVPPYPSWWGQNRWTPDELVLKKTLPIGPDGTVKVEVDTALAKELHGDLDANFTIEARVIDASRREERGVGVVIAGKKPFEIALWTTPGYSRPGEEVEASVTAATLDGKPVVGAKGNLKIYRLTAGQDRVVEQEVSSVSIETDIEGKISQRFPAPEMGQYRLSVTLSTNAGAAAEGGTILNIHTAGIAPAAEWKFGDIELIADKAFYAPGEVMKLRINSDHPDATVWLFSRISGSTAREAKLIQLDGKSSEIEVPLDLNDMPNMFIEAVTVHGAAFHSAVRQILLPPVSKLIDVEIEAKQRVGPREKSELGILLRDESGNPISGNAVITIYDKALEAITGGSNVDPIHENFWSWKNGYHPDRQFGFLPMSPGNLVRPGSVTMTTFNDFESASFEKSAAFGGGIGGKMKMDNNLREEAVMSMAAPEESGDGNGEATKPQTLVRSDFADLLKWSGKVKVGADGRASIPLEFPDNLTTWKVRVWTLGKGTEVGEGSTEIIASKELLVRMQAPRFLVEKDEAVLSAIIQNDHLVAKTVSVSLELKDQQIELISGESQSIFIAANSEARVDWRVKAVKEGNTTFRMRVEASDDGDAVERTIPVRIHGILRQDSWSRSIAPEQNLVRMEFEVPEKRRPELSKLTIRYSPSIAGAVVDAIPYLASYPHGCTEQILNRFVPAVLAQKILGDLDLDLASIKTTRTNLNPQEIGNPGVRALAWRQWQTNPVFDEAELKKMVTQGTDKLASMQNSDGGWGWFSGFGEISYPHTTAVVVHGLIRAKSSGAKIPETMLDAGLLWLANHEKNQTEALQLYVAREKIRTSGTDVPLDHRLEKSEADPVDAFVRLVLGEGEKENESMRDFLFRDRISLPVYAKCLLGLEMHRTRQVENRDEILRMISQFLKRDEENQTAYLELQNQNYWWNWYGSNIEAHAWYLKLLAATKPADPDTRGLVKYLVNNRKNATYWDSTRDTAYAIEAIADYFKTSGEDMPEMEVEVLIDGKSVRKTNINRDNLFTVDNTITFEGNEVLSGKHNIEIRRQGKGSVYANAYLEIFTLEDELRAAGLEVKIERRVSRLIPSVQEQRIPNLVGLVATQNAEKFDLELLKNGDSIRSGERVEVELIIEAKNDYEYILFSDSKAAGFEAVEALSGYLHASGMQIYMEPREQSVNFFVRSLRRGTNTIRYQLIAESPGIFKALPATASAMYAPELKSNSNDIQIRVQDKAE